MVEPYHDPLPVELHHHVPDTHVFKPRLAVGVVDFNEPRLVVPKKHHV